MIRRCSGELAGLQVQTPVALLRSLLDEYPKKRHEPLYPSTHGLNSITAVLLQGWLRH